MEITKKQKVAASVSFLVWLIIMYVVWYKKSDRNVWSFIGWSIVGSSVGYGLGMIAGFAVPDEAKSKPTTLTTPLKP